MRILALSDEVVPSLYSQYIFYTVGNVDLILACGDLPPGYLEYVVTILNVPLYYVLGNHDVFPYPSLPIPFGGTNLHRQIRREDDLLLLGFQGSRRYKEDGGPQYTEFEMFTNILSVAPAVFLQRLLGHQLDIVITHAPPYGIHDGPDHCHQGFKSFLWMMRLFRPRYLIHGHTHIYNRMNTRRTRYHDTIVLNAYRYILLEINTGQPTPSRE